MTSAETFLSLSLSLSSPFLSLKNEEEASGDSGRHRLLGAAPSAIFRRRSSCKFHPLTRIHASLRSSTSRASQCRSSRSPFPRRSTHRRRPQCHLRRFRTVYEGTKSFYKEEDEAVPVNVYGKSKVEAERFVSNNCQNFAILRSSIIYGPQTISPVPKSLPIQWMDGALAKGETMNFFNDEFRCPVFVKDLVSIIQFLTNQWISEGKQVQLLLNVGGPDRVSRVQMAEAVALVRGYSTSLIKPVPSSSVDRGVKSPSDISMDIGKLIQATGISPTPYTEGVKLTLVAEGSS
ncbi:hypothetical protein ABFX02_14G145600 [Erythranthe guttata]